MGVAVVLLVVGIVAANVLAETSLWQHRLQPIARIMRRHQPDEMKALTAPAWYACRPVESGILEVSLGLTAAAMALPSFIGQTQANAAVALAFDGVLALSAALGAASSLWLFRIYARQRMRGDAYAEAAPLTTPVAESLFAPSAAGPYTTMAYSMVLLLIGAAMLPLMVFV